MVKVCNFSFFDEQRILSPKTGEPLAIACSDEHLFVAEEGCVLEVYSLASKEPIAQIRTVSPVVQLLYNPRGDCIVTLERKNTTSRMFARVYFKWRESYNDRPMRVSLISSLTQGLLSGSQSVPAEINELPADETMSVNCVAVCKESGRIAVGMDSRIRLFCLTPVYKGGRVTSHSIEILLDVETGLAVRKVDVFNDYLAFISPREARVLKLSLLNEGPPPVRMGVAESEGSSTVAGWESDQAPPILPRPQKVQLIDRAKESLIKTDGHFVSWSPSKVWENERLSASGSLSASLTLSHDVEPHPLYDSLPPPHGSHDIETLALPAITMATQEKTIERHPVEVLGPVEYVWGQPVEVRLDEATPTTRCRVLTMLYRRFSLSQVDSDHNRRSTTMSLPPRGSRRSHDEWGLHTIELVPVRLEDSRAVIGVSCFIGSRLHGYLYDVAMTTRLVSSFSFTSDTTAVASDGCLFHALSQGTVETFSNRAMQVALYNRPPTESEHAKWLKQPCPSPNMDLTLMSSSKLIGGCCLATSRDYLVVLTKSGETSPTNNAATRLLQSLRRPTISEPTWNIYILLKKAPLPLYHQFVEYAETIRETSQSMYQHVISEGHIQLRNQLLQNGSLTSSAREELDKTLSLNCFSLADSLCSDIRGPKLVASIAAKYFVLSGASIAKVIHHITDNYTQARSLPYQILLKYLSLVLTGGEEIRGQLEPVAHTVLDLFAQHKPKQLPTVLLTSPLGLLAPEHGLALLSQHLQGGQKSPELFKGQLCHVILLLRLDRGAEAREVLQLVPEDFLVDWLKQNMSVVMDTSTVQLTSLGKMLWRHWEACLLELLSESMSSRQLTLDQLISLIKEVPADGLGLADNTLLKSLLERSVLNRDQESYQLPAALQLVDLLLARLVSTHLPRPPSSTPFSLYGSRHKWLDSLPPFDGSQPSQPPTQTMLQDLMQLQALLCSSELLPVMHVAQYTLTQLKECGQEVVGHLSLQLLTWPHVGKLRDAIVLALEECPPVTVGLCLTYLPSELSSWRDLLSLLLQHLLKTPHSLSLQALYKAALEHVVTMTTPEEFLGLLPSNGTLPFFLPFIESSLQKYVARQLGEQLNYNSPVK